jgi:hypothetical protein
MEQSPLKTRARKRSVKTGSMITCYAFPWLNAESEIRIAAVRNNAEFMGESSRKPIGHKDGARLKSSACSLSRGEAEHWLRTAFFAE